MNLQQKIKKDLIAAMKAKDEPAKNTLRVVMGEFGRADKKELADDDVVKILKKLVKAEKETLEKIGATEPSPFIQIIETYLPQMATETEISAWIQEHIDFSQYKSKMQAMAPIMKQFGSRADGNVVKEILKKI